MCADFNESLEGYMAFTYLFRYCRPALVNHFVYDVDAGNESAPNLILRGAEFNGEKMVGEYTTVIVSKEWVLENIDKILEKVPQGG